jgi:hypothetical protein
MGLYLINKSDTMLHVEWDPPDVFDPRYKDLLTHYRVTIAPLNSYNNWQAGQPKNYTVSVPETTLRFTDLRPETPYNITVRGGTDQGEGDVIWGVFSTLPVGHDHILKLKNRTPTTLTVEWKPVWGVNHRGYVVSFYWNYKLIHYYF